MVYGVIDRKSREHYTYLKEIFDAIGSRQTEYNWLITDSEIIAHSEELNALNTVVRWQNENGKPVAVPAPEYYFLSGEKLTKIVTQDDSQWIWGVLSGFEKGISPEEILKYPLPRTDGQSEFRLNQPSIQHPLAAIEIVPFDSSFVLFFSRDKEAVDSFKKAFPQSEELNAKDV